MSETTSNDTSSKISEETSEMDESIEDFEEEGDDKAGEDPDDQENETTETETADSITETGTTTDTTVETTTETSLETTTETTLETTSETTLETDSSITSAPKSLHDERQPTCYLLPQDILKLEGRRIRAEDFSWGISPVPTLADIIVDAANKIEAKISLSTTGSGLEAYLKYATDEQRERILEKLPLDLPLNITLPLLDDGTYWKRMYLEKWQPWVIWYFSDNWKSMFVHRTTQELIENFVPDQSNIWDLVENLKIYSDYVTTLRIQKLVKIKKEHATIDLSSENFDEQLDEIISAPQSPIYLDFERVFESFPHLQSLIIKIYPRYLDHEELYFNVADFNSLFRGLRKLKVLRKFRISNGTATGDQMKTIIKFFLAHTCLVELNLSYNFVDDDICKYIGKLLISECPLETLILKYNKITDIGAKSIAAALSENLRLKKLDLSLNMIGDEGGSFLANVLLFNVSIVDLDISKNKMNDDAGISFARLVGKSTVLRSLKIQENCLGEVAGKMLSRSVADNNSLLELNVHFCGFRNEDEGMIHQAILRNRLKVHYSAYVADNNVTAAEFLF